jgi:chromosome segregation ATPase
VTQIEALTFPELQAEVARLREELQTRDQLVQQLSQELFRLVKGNASSQPAAEMPERQAAELRALRDQVQGVEKQVTFYQEQLADREAEVFQLRQSVQELGDRSRMLEKVVQEMPHIYREKFDRRLSPIKEKVALIQRENRQLHAELQSVSYRLAVRSRRTNELDLPSFPRGGAALPSLG